MAEEKNDKGGFDLADPIAAFRAYAQEESIRVRETDINFDEELHDEALEKVAQRLKELAEASQGHDRS
uniref:Uncharacterized protein n=1 Tax=Magnetococcus massalia (strain MO-1) TaxID=451514 RepID=A0A1S7LKG3_MAGMO|nr:conserved protein of unknown function [Candidatus Magnetococcus massalia]